MKAYVLYHANCVDGLGAKLAAWLKFGNQAEYIPVNYDKPPPEIPDGSEVYILDFSYPRAVLEELHSRMAKLVVLDHHKTAKEALAGLDYAVFDMNRSGAGLAWGYFHPEVEVPHLLKLIQDRDLWKFAYPETRAVHAGILAAMGRGEERDDVAYLEPYLRYVGKLANDGEGILKYQNSIIDSVIDGKKYLARRYRVEGVEYKIAVVNQIPGLSSDTGHRLLEETDGADFCILYVVGSEGGVYLSIRSQGENDCTVLAQALARVFGDGIGGGHKNASGARVRLSWLADVYNYVMEEDVLVLTPVDPRALG